MNGASVLNRSGTAFGASHGLCRKVTKHIRKRRLEDGGYFFARVLPSGGMDTYFAVKSLALLGEIPCHPETIAGFFLRDIAERETSSIAGVFAAAEVLNELSQMTDEFRNYAAQAVRRFQNGAGGFGTLGAWDLESSRFPVGAATPK